MNYEELSDRELDALVAEKVMGGTLADDGFWEWPDSQLVSYDTPEYTKSIYLAFEVVEAMRPHYQFRLATFDKDIAAAFLKGAEVTADRVECAIPRAICLAALRATG